MEEMVYFCCQDKAKYQRPQDFPHLFRSFHCCDYLITPVVAASSDVKFKRILNRNAVPSIYPSPTFDKVKSK